MYTYTYNHVYVRMCKCANITMCICVYITYKTRMTYNMSRHRYNTGIYTTSCTQCMHRTRNALTAGGADSGPEPGDRCTGRPRSRMPARGQGGGRLAGTPAACASCPRQCPPLLRLRLTRPRVSSAVYMHTVCAGLLSLVYRNVCVCVCVCMVTPAATRNDWKMTRTRK
jgi:hypothetical protein